MRSDICRYPPARKGDSGKILLTADKVFAFQVAYMLDGQCVKDANLIDRTAAAAASDSRLASSGALPYVKE